jgi:hypothetical protein
VNEQEHEGPLPRPRDLILAGALSGLITCGFALQVEDARHWFVFPVAACGALVLLDALDVLRGRRDPFDPIALVGLSGINFFFLAPLVHVALDFWMYEAPPLCPWRDWLGSMAALNALGLLVYRIASRSSTRAPSPRPWRVNRARFLPVLLPALLVSLAVELVVFARLGGIQAQAETILVAKDASAVAGLGWAFLVGESAPALALLYFLVVFGKTARGRAWSTIGAVIVAFLTLKLLFGGFRGSRGNTIWALLWALGAINAWVRPIPRAFLAVVAALLLVFSFFYGFFKAGGFDGFEAATSTEARDEWVKKTKRGPEAVILGDLGRADIQAFALARTTEVGGDYRLGLGRTYVGDVTCLVPRSLWPGRFDGKVVEGTEITEGPGAFESIEGSYCTRQWGLAGECLLNFGPAGLPLVFLVFGCVVRRISNLSRDLAPDDARRLVLPIAAMACPQALAADLENLILFVIQFGGALILVLALSIERAPLQPSSSGGSR